MWVPVLTLAQTNSIYIYIFLSMEIIGLLAPWCIEKWVRLFGVTSMWLLSNLQTTQIIILIWPPPSFSIKMLLDPQICSHQPITPKFGPDIGGFTNLEEALLSLGGRPKNFVQIKKWRPHHFYPSNPSYHFFVVSCVLSTLCAKTCSWCINGVLDRLSHDVRMSSSSSSTVFVLAWLLLLTPSFTYKTHATSVHHPPV